MEPNSKIAVFSWNVGKKADIILSNQINEITKKLEIHKPKYLFICLQECLNSEDFKIAKNNNIFNTENSKYSFVSIKRKISMPLVADDFSLVILFYVLDKEENDEYEITCEAERKGFPIFPCDLNINKLVWTKHLQFYNIWKNKNLLFHIGNLHSEFGDTKPALNSLNIIDEYVNKRVAKFRDNPRPIILTGDFNSRSIPDGMCMEKDVAICSKDRKDINYCKWNGSPVEDIFGLYNTFLKNHKENSKENPDISYKNDLNKTCADKIESQRGGEQVSEPVPAPVSDSTMVEFKYIQEVQNLVNNDFLNYVMDKNILFKEFNEHSINFPPTYKISTEKFEDQYHYRQQKGNKDEGNGRLTGYPDRVIYKNPSSSPTQVESNTLEPVYYGALEMYGNDHLPVLGIFNIKNSAVAQVGGSKSKLSVRKSRNRKQRNRKSRNRKSRNRKSRNRKSRNRKSRNRKSRNSKSRNRKSNVRNRIK